MHALVLRRHDLASGLSWEEKAVPEPGPGEVTIDVQVAGIGLIDALWTSGAMPSELGFVPGLEVSGTVRALGEGVSGPAPGTAVAALLPGAGGFAEVARTQAALVAELPAGMDPALAAVIPINTVTAHLALTSLPGDLDGATVLVHAGVGGLGAPAGQIARLLGAHRVHAVVGTAAKSERALELGYDEVVLREDLDLLRADTYDVIVDPVGGEATASASRLLRGGGRLLRLGNASQAPDVPLSSMDHWLQNISTIGMNVGARLAARPQDGAASLAWSLAAVDVGRVLVDLSGIAGPHGVPALLGELEAGRTTGKLALDLRGATR